MTDKHSTEHWPEHLRSFGRRRGRKLSPRQSRLQTDVLPTVRVDPHDPLAGLSGRPVWLEIGFGGGEHLIAQASDNPTVGIIGCEPFEDGVVKVLTAIEEHRLSNIRIHGDDARAILPNIPDGAIERVFVLFPDPWPKRKHAKRRLLNATAFSQFARILRPGGELRIGTDIVDYARSLMVAAATEPRLEWQASSSQDWLVRPADWPSTRYEQKARREGRGCVYLRFRREQVRTDR